MMSNSSCRYNDSVPQAAIIAEQVFKEIRELKVAATPVHFTLLYEKASQLDHELAENLSLLIESKQYNDQTVRPVYRELIKRILNQHLPTSEVASLLSDALTNINVWAQTTSNQQKKLEHNLTALKSAKDQQEITQCVEQEIIPCIQSLNESTAQLQNKLNNSAAVIRKLKQELDDATQLAKTDSLTGIANRRGFNELMQKQIASAKDKGQTFSMLLIDLDHFKQVNDDYGHLVGDSALRYIAKLLRSETKGHDQISRFGGEEFVILLTDINYDNAMRYAEKLRSTIEKKSLKIRDHDKPLKMTVSMGIAMYQMGESADDLFKRADQALYLAKTKRNCVRGEHQL
ncbi:GGDEF domain-containing protein [Thiomicrospira microaerophila]|uniref:GGDEF domain-containing protein n=1 Tax=Thiomicrospira microaerophila TaxID=406020 RepID=UPI00200D55BA|nr:GGDEF domain-containing protein [Thiomicrospira microaerophila]UQB42916.1 GGDEF domain-containing protein [Thiomicrospira microaerophila]